MNTLVKSIVLSVALAATTVASFSPAMADDRWRRHHRNDNLAVGAAGLAAGVLLGSALSQPRYVDRGPVYVEPEYDDAVPVYRSRRVYVDEPDYYQARPVQTLRPWTGAWVRYCSQRYRTFDRQTGTFVGYDGQEHFCTAGG